MSHLDEIPRIPLAHLPTPLEPAPRLGAAIGLPRLWVKRDDNTGLALGGNKARKLEYLMAEAREQRADLVMTTGGIQSNHARMTAAAARRLGMGSVLFLCEPAPDRTQGNLLLDRLLGAEIRFLPDLSLGEMNREMAAAAEGFRAEGRRPYIIPVGGSTALGCLGYVRAVRELAEQLDAAGERLDAMTVAVGSTGTFAGILLGRDLFLPDTRVYGISVAPPAAVGARRCAAIAAEAAGLIGAAVREGIESPPVYDDWLGPAYGVPTPEGLEVIRTAARTEGLLLDPVYTGKALAGTRGLAERGALKPEETVLFWHTGGAPALFAFEELFARG
jgi:D-cysteine desulfhydrase family pyridoxal phosphate-dependent enzyme